jgi:peptidoglycan/xylan/chitin deacetylase (PgdA/CDA1 family)
MLLRLTRACVMVFCVSAGSAVAAECPGNPDALGTSRVLYVDPSDHRLVGSIQYPQTLPLADHEVVITFDDGPSRTDTPKVLDALRAECVKATFFMVGDMAQGAPAVVRRAYDEGHAIGTHSQHHPLHLSHMPIADAWADMEGGVATLTRALGEGRRISPFMRFPALDRTHDLEESAASQGLMIWSTDIYADDWMKITPAEVAGRPLERLAASGRGIVLFHDIHSRTVEALPVFLRGLKERGFKVVHVAAASADHAKTATGAADWRAISRDLLGAPGHMLQVHSRN